MSALQSKQERLHLRLDTRAKRKIERAASYLHKTTSEFVLANALAAAETVLHEQQQIQLAEGDWDRFMDALESPPPPNGNLVSALRAHDASVVQK
jgi:uncharacterized protein (DUF1778 family)